MTGKTVKYEFVKELLDKIDSYARDEDSHDYGLPLDYDNHNENLIAMVVQHFGLKLDENPLIAKIMNVTGCSREQALKLLEELK